RRPRWALHRRPWRAGPGAGGGPARLRAALRRVDDGQPWLLPAAGTNRRLTDFGSVEVFGRGRVEVLCAEQGSAGFAHYLAALEQRHLATGREVFLALDHASCHDSEQSQAALTARAEWLHVLPLARYSPHLNRKER